MHGLFIPKFIQRGDTKLSCHHIYTQSCYVTEWLLLKIGAVGESGIRKFILSLNEIK
jgi:hypothetical protein